VVPDVMADQVRLWLDGLSILKVWQVPRSYTGTSWNDFDSLEIHAFSDASERAYGACACLSCV
jgi:hypothetical protein